MTHVVLLQVRLQVSSLTQLQHRRKCGIVNLRHHTASYRCVKPSTTKSSKSFCAQKKNIKYIYTHEASADAYSRQQRYCKPDQRQHTEQHGQPHVVCHTAPANIQLTSQVSAVPYCKTHGWFRQTQPLAFAQNPATCQPTSAKKHALHLMQSAQFDTA
jgi:hypothetical protein